jgi:hypothetical protein
MLLFYTLLPFWSKLKITIAKAQTAQAVDAVIEAGD